MMTIKAFAQLCGCTAQTLRYYDRIGLLRPVQVDKWTGYRYYEKRQALDYVRIRSLQAADFTIGEIGQLLQATEEAVQAAFAQKIAAQEQKLMRIREIQQQYLREKSDMEKLLNGVTSYLLEGCQTPAVLREFGYREADGERVLSAVRSWLETTLDARSAHPGTVTLTVNGEKTEGIAPAAEKLAALPRDSYRDAVSLTDTEDAGDETYETVWEKHGWRRPAEFLQELPPLTGVQPYEFCVQLAEFPYPQDLSYGLYMLGVVMLERGAFPCRGCSVQLSGDGVNHFVLRRRR